MGASRFVTALAGLVVAGCGGVVQAGLANAPALGGSSETRVHDVIANGPDACERAMFPQGEVLRGQVPSCTPPERLRTQARAPAASPPAEVLPPRLEWFDACEAALAPVAPPRAGVSALYLSAPLPWTTCEGRRRRTGEV